MGKIKVVMNKPVYLGQAISDLSKMVMYEFHYDYMKRKYDDDKLTLCYMDTDSLIYDIKTKDFYKDQGWIGYAGTHFPMFVHKLGLIKPRQT